MVVLGAVTDMAAALDSIRAAGASPDTNSDITLPRANDQASTRDTAVCALGRNHPVLFQFFEPPGILRDSWSSGTGAAAWRMAGPRDYFSACKPRATQRQNFCIGAGGDRSCCLYCHDHSGGAIAVAATKLRYCRPT